MTVSLDSDYEICINERDDGKLEFWALSPEGDEIFGADISVETVGAIAQMATSALVAKLARERSGPEKVDTP